MRSGKQLLNAACTDATMEMEQLQRTLRGRAQLEKTIMHLQIVVQAAEAMNPFNVPTYASMLG
jgi:hypothetical protein